MIIKIYTIFFRFFRSRNLDNVGKRFYFCFVLGFTTIISAQIPKEYDSIYKKTYLEVSTKDFPKAIQLADSLFSVSKSSHYKAKSLMLSAALYQKAGDYEKSVNYALRADNIIEDTDLVWRVKVAGFLATQYRILELSEKSKKYIEKLEAILKEINNPKLSDVLSGQLFQEKAYYEYQKKNYKQSIIYLKQSQNYFNRNKTSDNDVLISECEQMIGLNYYYLRDYNKAQIYFKSALQKLKIQEDSHIKALVYNGLAKIAIKQNNLDEADRLLSKAETISKKANYPSLMNEILITSEDYFIARNDRSNLIETKLRKDSVISKISDNTSKFLDKSFSQIEVKNAEALDNVQYRNVIIAFCILILVCSTIFFTIYRKKQRQRFDRVKQILKELKEKESSSAISKNAAGPIKLTSNKQKLISSEVERNILLKLTAFENSRLFLDNTISLAQLATFCETNPKYISYIVNKQKNKDFNNYINELRIFHVIKLLNDNPLYRKYKISTIGEEVGFSSSSKFSTAFKKVTNISPSDYLREVVENKK